MNDPFTLRPMEPGPMQPVARISIQMKPPLFSSSAAPHTETCDEGRSLLSLV